MRLLEYNNDGELSLTKDFVGGRIPEYAILSHTWGPDIDEVTYRDLIDSTGKSKVGYKKIRFCGAQARRDGLHYFWVDTCCIDRSNNSELAEAINSMFRWYRDAAKCYVFLLDVPRQTVDGEDSSHSLPWESAFRTSRWFTRGWTLQELLAPTSVEFFSRHDMRLGDKGSLKQHIHEITGIPILALEGAPLSQFGVNERFSWAENRQTTRGEDKTYSLLGIFGIYLPLIYGEGTEHASKRLRKEIQNSLTENKQHLLDSQIRSCIQDLRTTDPREDKKRIEDTKGGLLRDSYQWIFEHPDTLLMENDGRVEGESRRSCLDRELDTMLQKTNGSEATSVLMKAFAKLFLEFENKKKKDTGKKTGKKMKEKGVKDIDWKKMKQELGWMVAVLTDPKKKTSWRSLMEKRYHDGSAPKGDTLRKKCLAWAENEVFVPLVDDGVLTAEQLNAFLQTKKDSKYEYQPRDSRREKVAARQGLKSASRRSDGAALGRRQRNGAAVSWFTGILQLLRDHLARSLAGLGFHSFDRISAPEAPYIRILNHAP